MRKKKKLLLKAKNQREEGRKGGGMETEFLALKHECRNLGQSSNPVCGFSMMEQVSSVLFGPWRTGLALP